MSNTKATSPSVRLEVVVPFAENHLAAFRKGEIFTCPADKAKQFLDGGLVRLAPADVKPAERAVASSQRK